MQRKKIKLGDLLVSQNLISEDQLRKALEEQKIRKMKLGETLLELGFITQEEMANVLSKQLGIEKIDLRRVKINDEAVKLVGEVMIKKHRLLPFGFDPENPNILYIAMSDPMDFVAMDDVSIATNMIVEPFFSPSNQVDYHIDKVFGKQQAMAAAEKYQQDHAQEFAALDASEPLYTEEIENSPIVLLVKTIVEQAVMQRASDIHIEPLEENIRVRFRVDGVLGEVMTYDSGILAAIVARVKIISNLDISEKRKPQDGRMTMIINRNEYDIRVSILPTVFGEKIVMRLTPKDALTKDKKQLGMRDLDLEKFEDLLKNPHGIILVTGPTGSGKSTTLYTAINELNVDSVNIVTVEDPVEAHIDGISQVQVNNKVNLTFANTIRSILRQDPDIIMIGEIRDEETAKIAIQASVTGHLVVSTLHTNNTVGTVTRLMDMGIEPYLIADSVVGIIAQRLVRKLCSCKKSREATAVEKKLLEKDGEEIILYEPRGCELCNHTGYVGRIGVYEILPVTAEVRGKISESATADDIKELAIEQGMTTLRENVAKYVLEGTTSMQEMVRIAYELE